MVSWKTVVAVVAWFFKVCLLLIGIMALFYPDFAVYIRLVGAVGIIIAILSFRTPQKKLLSEYGVRIPNVVVGVLLIGAIVAIVLVFPSANDLEITDESAEVTNADLVYEMTVTNTGDGSVIGTGITVYVNSSGTTISEQQVLEDGDIGRGKSQTFTVEVPLNELDEDTRSRIAEGEYEIYVVMDDGFENSHRYSPQG